MTDQQDNERKISDPAARPVPLSTESENPTSNTGQGSSASNTAANPVASAGGVSAAPSPAIVGPTPPPPPLDPIVAAAMAAIEDRANRAQQNLPVFSLGAWKRHLNEIETVSDDCVNALITTSLGHGNNEAKKELLEVVKDRRSKIPLSTGITDQILSICQSILAFGAGGLALSMAFIDKASLLSITVQKYLAIAGLFYVELVIISVIALILYMLQARFRYPSIYFKKIGNAWPWFYYSSISTDVPRGPIQLSLKRLKASKLYAEDFVKFTQRVLEEDCTKRLRNEIQQYFLLMSYQGYVHQFSLRLANFFMYGFVGAFITSLIMLLLVGVFGL